MENGRLARLGSDAQARAARVLLGGLTIVAVCVLLVAGPGVWRAAVAGDADPGALVAGLCLALAWITACRVLLAGVALLVATSLERAGAASRVAGSVREVSRRLTPAVLRGVVRLAVGATVAVGPLTGAVAHADVTPGPSAGASAVSSSAQLPDLDRLARVPVMAVAPMPGSTKDAGGAGPSTPTGAPVSHVVVVAPDPAPPQPSRPGAREVVVRPGDSLWRIAARHLPVGHSDADVAREWPRWYAANRVTIGADPNVIRPGQVLQRPSS